MESITPQHFLILAFLLFGIGFLGVVIRRNLLLVLMSLELMLNGVNVAVVTFSRTGSNLDGSLFVFFIMTVAAAEVAVGLALLVALYKSVKASFQKMLPCFRTDPDGIGYFKRLVITFNFIIGNLAFSQKERKCCCIIIRCNCRRDFGLFFILDFSNWGRSLCLGDVLVEIS